MISSLITPGDIKVTLEGEDRDECLAELLELSVAKNPDINRTEAYNALIAREQKMSTAVYPFIAVPHAVIKSTDKTVISIGVDRRGIEFESNDANDYNSVKVNVIFEILFQEDDTDSHLHVLRDILQLASNPEFIEKMLDAKNQQEVYDVIAELEV